jgi:hypothetical protein
LKTKSVPGGNRTRDLFGVKGVFSNIRAVLPTLNISERKKERDRDREKSLNPIWAFYI